MRIKAIEELPRDMVGDGKRPNVFFVSTVKDGVILMARSFTTAYQVWKGLPRDIETMLEDRLTGVICDTSPIEDGSKQLRTYDDHRMHGFREVY